MNTLPRLFSWGDEVFVRDEAEQRFRPGQYAVVVSLNEIKLADGKVKSNYTIEYDDGTSLEIEEHLLRLKRKWSDEHGDAAP